MVASVRYIHLQLTFAWVQVKFFVPWKGATKAVSLFKLAGWQYLSWAFYPAFDLTPRPLRRRGSLTQKILALFYWRAESLIWCIYN